MALAVLATGGLRALLPAQLRWGDARWIYPAVVIVLLGVIFVGDPGHIYRQSRGLRVITGTLFAVISVANAEAAIRLVASILSADPFTHHANRLLVSGGAIWLINVIVFGLWYWDVDRGGAAARSRGSTIDPAFIFPEMVNPGYVRAGWYPKFVDYLHLSFTSATAFSPTDVSAIRPWAKLLMMAEESISLLLALLVVGYAVGILK